MIQLNPTALIDRKLKQVAEDLEALGLPVVLVSISPIGTHMVATAQAFPSVTTMVGQFAQSVVDGAKPSPMPDPKTGLILPPNGKLR